MTDDYITLVFERCVVRATQRWKSAIWGKPASHPDDYQLPAISVL
jgi:hypothetical protein